MPKIDQAGIEKLDHAKNALDALFDVLERNNLGGNKEITELMSYIADIIQEAKTSWEKV
jgi:hypothetical protein|tara:strand:+ start:359 stop:535 length:177 start_codon:yes stop_codon:yes gene_type:complete